jgi:hypothetical protein
MKSLLFKIAAVVLLTALSVFFIPGLDDAVESIFQIIVLVASS